MAPRKPTLTKTTTHPTHRMDMGTKPSFNTFTKSMHRGRPRTTTDTKPDRRVLAETLDELKVLGLSGRTFEPEEFAAALASYLTLDIKISSFADPSYPLLRKHMESMGVIAAVFHSADHSTAWVLIPDGITGIPRRKVIYHELVHLAAGHPIWPKHLLHEERMSVLHEDQPYNPPQQAGAARAAARQDLLRERRRPKSGSLAQGQRLWSQSRRPARALVRHQGPRLPVARLVVRNHGQDNAPLTGSADRTAPKTR